MGTGYLLGVKRPGRGVDNPPTSSAEVKERVEVYIYSPSGPHGVLLGDLYLYLYPPNAVVVFSVQFCFAKYCVGKFFAFFVYFPDMAFAVYMSM
jgi:hypothetical protein